ncbi:DUF1674 domain-containing protein [Salinisphaera aquimarina]|uniref:DUF1674 domain-containing protein n=1 Tax=Salinisphaera aquimarina TaxID=2094031 RepID=A0ABV7EP39_9GAMM
MSDERLSPLEDGEATQPASSEEQRDANGRTQPSPSPATRSLDLPREYGGRKGLEPVRYGDWEKNGRCIDF